MLHPVNLDCLRFHLILLFRCFGNRSRFYPLKPKTNRYFNNHIASSVMQIRLLVSIFSPL